jgi:uncharacterized membrane protein
MIYSKLFVSAFILVFIDSIYLTLITPLFSKQIEIIQSSHIKINYLSAIMSYIFLLFALNYFIINSKRSVQEAFLLGFLIYGVYETTNKALFSKWTWLTVFIDTLWGGILFALTTYIVYHII